MHTVISAAPRLGAWIASCFLACLCSGIEPSQVSGRQWMNQYYQDPAPDQFVPAVFELSRTGYLRLPGQAMTSLGFMASLFQHHPERVDEWLLHCQVLPERELDMVGAALWYAGFPRGRDYLKKRATTHGVERIASLVGQEFRTDRRMAEAPVESKSALYFRWGMFLATGDTENLQRMFVAIPEIKTLTAQDRWWLACTLAEHPMVLDWCVTELAAQPTDVQFTMEMVLDAARRLAAH